MAFTQIEAAGITSTSTVVLQNASVTGVLTATSGFVGNLTGSVIGAVTGNTTGTHIGNVQTNAITTVAGKPILNSTGSILQVVQATYTNNTSFSTGTTQLITGLSASITPSSSSNKILILFTVNMSATQNQPGIIIYRNGSALTASTGDGGGSRGRVTTAGTVTGATYISPCSNSFLDSPATTSATTYALYLTNNSGGTAYVNQSATDNDNAAYLRPASFMQLMEVSA